MTNAAVFRQALLGGFRPEVHAAEPYAWLWQELSATTAAPGSAARSRWSGF